MTEKWPRLVLCLCCLFCSSIKTEVMKNFAYVLDTIYPKMQQEQPLLSKKQKIGEVKLTQSEENWIKNRGMSHEEYQAFIKSLDVFTENDDVATLKKEPKLLKTIVAVESCTFLQFFYKKLGKVAFGEMVTEAIKNKTFVDAVSVTDLFKLPITESCFRWVWANCILDSQFDYILQNFASETDIYTLWFSDNAPSELKENTERLLKACNKLKYDMKPALEGALYNGYYSIARFLIEEAPDLITTLAQPENIVGNYIKDFNQTKGFPSLSTLKTKADVLLVEMQEVFEKHPALGASFEPLKNVKTMTIKQLDEAIRAYSKEPSAKDNKKLGKFWGMVQWRENAKDIIALLRKKALEKNIQINLSQYTTKQLEEAEVADIFDGSYVPQN